MDSGWSSMEWTVFILVVGGLFAFALWMVGIYVRGVWQDERTKPKRLRDPRD